MVGMERTETQRWHGGAALLVWSVAALSIWGLIALCLQAF